MSKQSNDILNKINFGWNLGNYFDCHSGGISTKMSGNKTVDQVVGLWHNPKFNLKCLDNLNNVGVNCLRIPVTWCNFVEYNGKDYLINKDIFARLKQIVDYALALDYVVIIDMHHDDKNWLSITSSEIEFEEVKHEYINLWQQICIEFKNYNHNLIFEGMNELINISNNNEDWIGNDLGYQRVNELCELFVKTVRASGDKNKDRCLMIAPYGAQFHKHALRNFALPNDNNIIVDVHFYGKTIDKEVYIDYFKHLRALLLSNNIPVFVGEIGLKKAYRDRLDIFKVLIGYMKELNLKIALWDNGTDRIFIDRETGKIENQQFLDFVQNLHLNPDYTAKKST